MLPCIEIEPVRPADATVIWLHGLGASGHDFEPVVPELQLPTSSALRFVFPHAPTIPVTINGGLRMPAWYDILEVSLNRRVDQDQLRASAAALQALIEREIERGIDSRRIVVAGFSQGGAVAYEGALSCPHPLGGLLALSTYFATAASVALHPANRGLPIDIHHGSRDPMVPEALGHEAAQVLRSMGYQPAYHTYPMEHAVCAEETAAIATALTRWLALG